MYQDDWTAQQSGETTSSIGYEEYLYGTSVAMVGDKLIVGAPGMAQVVHTNSDHTRSGICL